MCAYVILSTLFAQKTKFADKGRQVVIHRPLFTSIYAKQRATSSKTTANCMEKINA